MSVQQSADRVLTVLDVLLVHTVNGLTASELVRATGFTAPSISRYVATLEHSGWAERVPETNRIRASVRVAQRAVGVLNDFDKAQQRLNEMRSRIAATI